MASVYESPTCEPAGGFLEPVKETWFYVETVIAVAFVAAAVVVLILVDFNCPPATNLEAQPN